ncbi:meiotic recombination protein REC8 homolog [Saccoglossus kowalevskii]
MFYSYDILERRGKFGVVWLAATKAAKLHRKDYSKVNIRRTCTDIVKVINVQPSKEKRNMPRFSLYLSSQLMYGVVCVHQQHCAYLIGDVQRLYDKFHQTQNLPPADTAFIDLPSHVRSVDFCTLPDPISLQESAVDPDFGVIPSLRGDFITMVLDPYSIPLVEPMLTSPPPRLRISSSDLSSPQDQMLAALGSPHTVRTRSEISLKEDHIVEGAQIVQFGDDLPPMGDIGEMMMQDISGITSPARHLEEIRDQPVLPASTPQEQSMWLIDPDTGLLKLSPILEDAVRKRRKKDTKVEASDRKKQSVDETIEEEGKKLDTRPKDVSGISSGESPERPSAVDQDLVQLQTKSPELADDGLHDFVTPSGTTARKRKLHLLELSPIEEDERKELSHRKKKARRLVFADASIKLSREDLKKNFTESKALCTELILPQVTKFPTLKELFERPGRKGLHPSLTKCWARNTATEEVDYSTDEERAIWSVAYLHPRISPPRTEESELDSRDSVSKTFGRKRRHDITEASIEEMREREFEKSHLGLDETPSSIIDTSRQLSESKRSSSTTTSFQLEMSSRPGTGLEKIEETVAQPLEEMILGETEPLHLDVPLEYPTIIESTESEDEKKMVPTMHHTDIIRKIGILTIDNPTATFEELVPLTTKRNIAALMFSACLDCAATGHMSLDQEISYGPIYIRRGPNF